MGHSAGAPGFQAKELYEEDARRTSMGDVYTFGGVILAVSPPADVAAGTRSLNLLAGIEREDPILPDG